MSFFLYKSMKQKFYHFVLFSLFPVKVQYLIPVDLINCILLFSKCRSLQSCTTDAFSVEGGYEHFIEDRNETIKSIQTTTYRKWEE